MKRTNEIRKKKKIGAFDMVNTILVILITLVTIYPLYFCVIASFSDPQQDQGFYLGTVSVCAAGEQDMDRISEQHHLYVFRDAL